MPPRRRRRMRQLEGAGAQMICRAVSQSGLGEQARQLRIHFLWAQAVGPEIAARTAPQSFGRGVLVVKAATPTWQNELTYLKAGIIARLNTLLGKPLVRELKVLGGRLAPPPPPPPPPVVMPEPLPEDVAVAAAMAACIDDPALRSTCIRVVARCRRVALNRQEAWPPAPAGRAPTPPPPR